MIDFDWEETTLYGGPSDGKTVLYVPQCGTIIDVDSKSAYCWNEETGRYEFRCSIVPQVRAKSKWPQIALWCLFSIVCGIAGFWFGQLIGLVLWLIGM